MQSACRIFFSYSWKDLGLAMRIDSDLRRSGVTGIWRDRIDGQICGNFKEEYRQKIRECETFILLDSPNYRHESNYCRDEIATFLACRRLQPQKRLVICLAEAVGPWRNEALLENEKEQLYVDFGTGGIYDNEGTYHAAINTLCAFWGVKFVPWTREIFEQDLLDELQQCSCLDETVRQRLLEDYRSAEFFALRNFPSAENRIRNLIADCDYIGSNLMFPQIFLCEYLLEKNRPDDCRKELATAKERFPTDSRPLKWSGTLAYLLGESEAAYTEYLGAETLLLQAGDAAQRCDLAGVRLNILRTLVRLERFDEARSRAKHFLQTYPETLWTTWKYYAYAAQAFLFSGVLSNQIREMLLRGIDRFPEEPSLYALTGFCDFMNGKAQRAVSFYRDAIHRAATYEDMLEYASHLAVIYSKAGSLYELEELKTICIQSGSVQENLSNRAKKNLTDICSLQ